MSEQDDKSDSVIQKLISAGAQDAMTRAINDQYMYYCPWIVLPDEYEGHGSRLEQVRRIVIEFGLGAPTKFINYVRAELHASQAGLLGLPMALLRGAKSNFAGLSYVIRGLWDKRTVMIKKSEVLAGFDLDPKGYEQYGEYPDGDYPEDDSP